MLGMCTGGTPPHLFVDRKEREIEKERERI
jgi:hypothetical protein